MLLHCNMHITLSQPLLFSAHILLFRFPYRTVLDIWIIMQTLRNRRIQILLLLLRSKFHLGNDLTQNQSIFTMFEFRTLFIKHIAYVFGLVLSIQV